MRKLIGIAILLVGAAILMAQPAVTPATTEAPPAGFENVREMGGDVFDIQIKAFIPDITTFKNKADTYNKEGYYNFPKDFLGLVQAVSKEQITNWQALRNKWLEESK